MRKLIGTAAVILAISGCSGDTPRSADVARTEANIASLERVADVSCPTTALTVHALASKARDAIALNRPDLLTIAAAGVTFATPICKSEKENPQLYAFDPAALEQFKRPGSAALVGQAFMRHRGGGVVTCAGQSVTLMVETPSVDAVHPALMYGASLPPEAVQHLADSTVRETTCDAQGHFAFKGIVPGDYLVGTTVTWMAGDEPQGGPMKKPVKVSPGDNEVILSQ